MTGLRPAGTTAPRTGAAEAAPSGRTRAADVTPPDSTVLRRGAYSWLLPRRSALTAAVLVPVVAVLVALAVMASSTGMSLPETLSGLLGTGDPGTVMIVRDFRLPRIFVGLLVGASLGIAGCLTQTLAGNRLATPDLVGVNDGATAAVVAAAAGSTTGMVGNWWLGPVGAVAAAVIVVLCAGGAGSAGYRVLVTGIGVSTFLGAVGDLIMSRENDNTAGGVFLWAVGSLNGRDWGVGTPLALVLLLLVPLALAVGHRLQLLRFDDDVAASLGVDLRRLRAGALALAVALAGTAVGVGGPIAFVALAAPILAQRLAGPTRVPVTGSALTGAALIAAADALGRVAAPVELPVGVVTSVLGGPFLLWVLFRPDRATGKA
ncbi:iron complex transport system permease protein [Streptomyces sp. LamerLS-316]|uniref:FecCD family ABC transporter permease n=1 Tax=unclassified Streptomyces TaxID=2593676 RepID=UPI0008237F65|nr:MULTISPECIES: iron ABC transporter permease [unclassified Streptomyces]MYQ37463.1 iron chelate uptake ABC transporter family permease subunit [Streptomyces sp. SID4921]SCK44756.1 iron complex transport system permease protein [Streptomyces sp. LamerLS-316]